MNEIFAPENWLLIFILLVWIGIAIIQDFKRREVANWLSFSLIAIALVYRAFLSVSIGDYWLILWGVIGLAGGFVIANLFYYARLFAGGDAKLLMGAGVVLPLASSWQGNLKLLILFVFFLIVLGGIYGAIYSAYCMIINFRRFLAEFLKQTKKYKWVVVGNLVLSAVLLGLCIYSEFYYALWFVGLFFLSPWLLLYAKAIESACMIRAVNPKNVAIGDWLIESVKVDGRTIKPDWEGLSELEAELIQKGCRKKILVKYGIPFTPAFLLAFIAMLYAYSTNWMNLIGWISYFFK